MSDIPSSDFMNQEDSFDQNQNNTLIFPVRKTRKLITRETINSFLNLIKSEKKCKEIMDAFDLSRNAVNNLIKSYSSGKLNKAEDYKPANW
ncbi:hypothetical protein GVAV_001150 [Gurleya vavrai]